MKRFFAIILFCCSLISCSAAKEDMPVQILAEKLGEEIDGFENLTEASSDYIKYCIGSDLSLYSEYIILYPFSGTVYNELGIFKVKDMNAVNEGIEEVKKYISFKKENWDMRYNSDEYKKIESANVTRFGKYILYTILDTEESKEVEKHFREELR